MSPANDHNCLVCDFVKVPIYRCFCEVCFGQVPWKLRADVMRTYRFRGVHREPYEQKLAELRQWIDGDGK